MNVQWTFSALLVCFFGVEAHFDWGDEIRSIRNETAQTRFIFGYYSGLTGIYPGTKWCGKGNVASDDNDLGGHLETDACCRAHDMCDAVIEGGHSKYGLTNHAPYTRLHCSCDEAFLNCLKNSKDERKASLVVGTLYFDLLNTKCFKQEHTVTGCKKYSSVIGTRCKEYAIDSASPETYQWFDVPIFNEK